MDKERIERYSRQMLVPGMGVEGQRALAAATVAVVGLGGLGSPVALYLAGAGVGRLLLVDGDAVEASNLPRQVLHPEAARGTSKAHSARDALQARNAHVAYEPHAVQLDADNALAVLRGSTVIVDCTDNAATRYLLNDAACALRVPLVTGAALGWAGQLSVVDPARGTPCYRCLHPVPPPPAAACSCDDGGIAGPVAGAVGALQALQVLRLLAGLPPACTDSLLLFDADAPDRLFRQPRVRARNPTCPACGPDQSHIVARDSAGTPLRLLPDYARWCPGLGPGTPSDPALLAPPLRLAPTALVLPAPDLLIDVRPARHFALCALPGARSFPYALLAAPGSALLRDLLALVSSLPPPVRVVCVCRRGFDSQRAVALLLPLLPPGVSATDVAGGLTAYAATVDPNFPVY